MNDGKTKSLRDDLLGVGQEPPSDAPPRPTLTVDAVPTPEPASGDALRRSARAGLTARSPGDPGLHRGSAKPGSCRELLGTLPSDESLRVTAATSTRRVLEDL